MLRDGMLVMLSVLLVLVIVWLVLYACFFKRLRERRVLRTLHGVPQGLAREALAQRCRMILLDLTLTDLEEMRQIERRIGPPGPEGSPDLKVHVYVLTAAGCKRIACSG